MGLTAIFLNNVGRLRSGWRFTIYMLALYLTVSVFFALAGLLLHGGELSAETLEASYWAWALQAFILLSAATMVGWACGRIFEDLPARALGWGWHQGWVRDWLKGSLLGASSLLLATLIATIFGGFTFRLNPLATASAILKTLLLSAFIFVLAAAAEEAMFRGYPLQTMTRSRLAWPAVILTAAIFSLGHLSNPHVVPYFTFINTALAGVWLAVAYLRTRSLWFPLGLHWSWNWMMGSVLGLPVSGIEHLTPNPLIRADAFGPAWLNGGAYGIEGGLACTIAILASTVFVWRTKLVSATEEMKRLTDNENPLATEPVLSLFEPPPPAASLSSEGQDAGQ